MKAQVVTFHCVLKDSFGQVISRTFNRDILTANAEQGGLLKGLARGLQDLRTGEHREIRLSAEDAYGFYDPRNVIVRSRDELPKDLRAGDEVRLATQGLKLFRVHSVTAETVVFDGNHPLAGQDLVFEIETVAARDATDDEITESLGLPCHH